ncbi:precorrin-2 dehydrogenase/sirohydrochlorin ferrochelatase family protein [Escherichia coli]|uniref:precorrin-2 dehydrogenase/sirohydrochlorin ferrochelatase family protein n=1 Tax=Escherichia coli TaxID=562 RepID=UPI0007EED964|nr:NAD(P)-dependent oxidoreductase [Escherichia coli]
MDYFPIFCNLRGKRCLIVGGGQVATHKVKGLLAAGAVLRLVAPTLSPELASLYASGDIEWYPVTFSPQYLHSCWLVIAATSDPQVNRLVSEAASAERLFCNVTDDPSAASFISPSIIDHSPVIIALSCGGNAPVYSKILKAHVAAHLPSGMRESVRLAGALRGRINSVSGDRERKRAFWTVFFRHAPLQQALAQGNEREVKQQVEWLIQHMLLSE